MKKIFLSALCSMPLLFSCNAGKEAAHQRGTANLLGTWELREAQRGRMPARQLPPGSGDFFTFTKTGFEQVSNGIQSNSGAYLVMPDSTAFETVGLQLPPGQFTHRIVFKQDTADKTFIDVRGDTLILLTGFFPVDAGERRLYIKTKNNR
jgi:hypothetical protein